MTPIAPPLAALAATPASPSQGRGDEALHKVAQEFEATFLAEMLKHAGVGQQRNEFSGGEGEDAFSSFLTRAYADEIAQTGGLGLAESIFEALKARETQG